MKRRKTKTIHDSLVLVHPTDPNDEQYWCLGPQMKDYPSFDIWAIHRCMWCKSKHKANRLLPFYRVIPIGFHPQEGV